LSTQINFIILTEHKPLDWHYLLKTGGMKANYTVITKFVDIT